MIKVEKNVTLKTTEEVEKLATDLVKRGYSPYSLSDSLAKMFRCNVIITFREDDWILNLIQPL